ncbi:MAG: hypothetical protein ABH864_06045 [archaeon]
MNPLRYIARSIEAYVEKTRRINEEYQEAFKQCFEGTPDQVERKLAAWDFVHEITRSTVRRY